MLLMCLEDNKYQTIIAIKQLQIIHLEGCLTTRLIENQLIFNIGLIAQSGIFYIYRVDNILTSDSSQSSADSDQLTLSFISQQYTRQPLMESIKTGNDHRSLNISQAAFKDTLLNVQEFANNYKDFHNAMSAKMESIKTSTNNLLDTHNNNQARAKNLLAALDEAIKEKMVKLEKKIEEKNIINTQQDEKEFQQPEEEHDNSEENGESSDENDESASEDSFKETQTHPSNQLQKTKGRQEQLEIFSCFLCFHKEKNIWTWDNEHSYLKHMRGEHDIQPEFGVILTSHVKKLPCSHAFFKGKLTNLLNNMENKKFKQIIHLLQRESYDELYFCGCCPSKINKYSRKRSYLLPIFMDKDQYITHLSSKSTQYTKYHKNGVNYQSHLFIENNKNKLVLERNPNFIYKNIPQNFKQSFEKLKVPIQFELSRFIKRLLTLIPLNILELYSCYPQTVRRLFYLFCYCKQCDLVLTLNHMRNHYKEYHSSQQYQQFIKWTSLLDLQDLKTIGRTMKKQLKEMLEFKEVEVSQSEAVMLNAQLFCLNNKIRNQPLYYCRSCQKIIGNPNELFQGKCHYALHIYCDHPQIHPSNPYVFTFLMEKPSIDDEYDDL